MKYFIKYTLLCMAFISFSSCDLEQYVEDTFSGKRLVIISPSFLKNTVQVVFKNDQTGALLDKNMNLTVFSNKKTIDMSGNYKTEFVVKGGFLEFAIDPNENISASDPLELIIVGIDETGDYMPFYKETSTKSQGALSILFREDPSNINFEANATKKAAGIQKLRTSTDFNLTYNDMSFDTDFYKQWGKLASWQGGYEYVEELNSYVLSFFKDEIIIKIENLIANESELTKISEVNIWGKRTNGERFLLTEKNSFFWGGSGPIPINLPPAVNFDLKTGISVMPALANFPLEKLRVSFVVSENNLDLKKCDNCLNAIVSGIPIETAVIEYEITGAHKTLFGLLNIIENKIEIPFQFAPSSKSLIKFKEHNQLLVAPELLALTIGDFIAGKLNWDVKTKEGLVKTTLNLQFQCESDNYASAPTVSAFMKEKSSEIEPDLIQFKNGETNLYLKPDGSYVVNGKFNNTDFGFTFVNNKANIEASIIQTIQDNTNIEDIFYKFFNNDGQVTIHAVVIFKAGSCP